MVCVTPIGIGREANWDALRRGESGVRRIESFDVTDSPVKTILVTHEMDVVKYVTPASAVVSEKGEVAVKDEGGELCLTNTSILMLRDGRVSFNGTDEELVKAEDPYIQKFMRGTEIETDDAADEERP